MVKFEILLDDISMEECSMLCGPNESHLNCIRNAFHVEINLRDSKLIVLDQDTTKKEMIENCIYGILQMIKNNLVIQERDVIYACRLAKQGKADGLKHLYSKAIGKTIGGKLIFPKTIGQHYLFRCMEKDEIVFAHGVAGTGKTYLAVVYAVSLLKKGEINKIILTRPAVEAGENLGFLPGDLKEKVDPYLRPLYDALNDTLGNETVLRYLEKEIIEIAPLAYMRGRTLDNAFIILDEAQNTTRSQMKMFLTRMGFHSKIVITGDITQIDLIKKADSGLVDAKRLLQGIEGISFVELTSLDVVRNPMVQKIIERYEQEDE